MEKEPNPNLFPHINPENYDFLWTVGIHFLFCSVQHESGYSPRDFVSCHNKNSYTLFVSKKERALLGEEGLRFYTQDFDAYHASITQKLPEYKKRIGEIKQSDLSSLSQKELSTGFAAMTQLVLELWRNYFPTEYHSSDLVTKIHAEKDERYDLVKLSDTLERMAKIKFLQRQLLNDTWYEGNVINKYAEEIQKRVPLKYSVYNYRYTELLDILNGKEVTVPDRSGYVIYGLFSAGTDIVGENAKIIFDRLQKVDHDLKELKGNIGNKGFYRGTVKKINFSAETDFVHEISIMQEGQVLVSGSTGPEMILACKKAGAIVTDEGGIISHAALVSRELGIPSVIATKFATKILKDGDLVEVDAHNGIVRIINK